MWRGEAVAENATANYFADMNPKCSGVLLGTKPEVAMKRLWVAAVIGAVYLTVAHSGRAPLGRTLYATKDDGPPKSAFFDFRELTDFQLGLGNVSKLSCTIGAAVQPAVYAGNMLLDCDAEVPHNETTIAVDPNDPHHVVGGYHSYQIVRTVNTVHQHVIGTTS